MNRIHTAVLRCDYVQLPAEIDAEIDEDVKRNFPEEGSAACGKCTLSVSDSDKYDSARTVLKYVHQCEPQAVPVCKGKLSVAFSISSGGQF